ncbi:helix-turn-helix domain-containing protein [Streptomyces sp. NPDC005463]|uniref:helix-turn-helix domain-containing protein n=1 Tax=Streptomyces sp. NPDC005463 TaxID=3154465 RepID=UPI0033BD59EF
MDKGKQLTGPERDKLAGELKTAYESGASIRALAQDSGRSYGFVHRILSEAGTTLRGRGGDTRAPLPH